MKVCFFNTNLAWGGGERWHFDMAKSLHLKNYQVTLVTHPVGSIRQAAKEEKFSQFVIKLGNLSFLNPFKILRLVNLFKKIQPDILILNLPRDAKAAGLAAKIAGVKQIVYRRGSAIPIKNNPVNRFIFKHVISHIIANSKETKHTILKNNPNLFDAKNIHVIYNGIELEPFNILPEKEDSKEFVIGNLGRLVEQKGQIYLIELAEILKAKGFQFKIIIGGDGALHEKLIAQAKSKNVEDFIEFEGFVNDIPQFMNKLDVFVLPSLWEGFGYVIVEAMAAKLPVVAFNVSSNPELIRDGVNGYLTGCKNISELAEKVELLYTDKLLRNKMGEQGREIVFEKFTNQIALDNLEKLLKQICPNLN